MAKPYRLSPLAELDLEEIWLYTLNRWSPEQADNYLHNLTLAFEALTSGKRRGSPSVLPDFQKYLCGSHVIYFLDYAEHLDIIRVLHQRQDVNLHLT
ncbi:MAG: type II toxin-antitoxin system RelE/ParE family toxin [Alcaligenaceae bacterium]|jgi:toxin ParE1/3/4|nr:type II toxin-antitoxin system RelE/ParE family toxin [Alcaligenaceae bacterium]